MGDGFKEEFSDAACEATDNRKEEISELKTLPCVLDSAAKQILLALTRDRLSTFMRPPVCNSEDHPESGREVQEHGSSCPRRARSRQRQGKGPGRFQIRRPVTPSTTSRHRSREKEGSRSAVPDLRRQAAGGPSPTTTSGRISSPSWWREDLCEDFDRQDHHFERRDL